ncbi:MAG: MATE family efflux transporter [Eggerthellaceae bacterium]|jgi:putative MATE family efflux protein
MTDSIEVKHDGQVLSDDRVDSGQGHHDRVDRMGSASVVRLVIEFALPAIAGMVVNGAYNLIDSIFLGQALGEIGLSTATVANPIMIFFMALSMLFGTGGNALAALRLGERRREDAELSLGNTVSLSIFISVFIAVVVLFEPSLNALLSLAGCTEEIRPFAQSFVTILGLGYIFQCIGMGVNNFIRTAGAPTRALVTMLIGAASCTVLNFLFVLVFDWGVVGSALATVLGQGISCIAVLWFFLVTKSAPIKLKRKYLRLSGKTVRLILGLGVASFLVQIGASVVNLVLNNMLATIGAQSPMGAEDALASIGVVQRVAVFSVLPLIGVSIAIQPLLGYNYGAHLFNRVRQTLGFGVAVAMGLGFIMWILIHVFPGEIVRAFGISHPGLEEFTAFALMVQLSLLPFVGFQIVGSNYFQATGQPLKSVVLSLTRQILFLIPLLLMLPYYLPLWFPQFTALDALYFAHPISDFFATLLTLVLILFELRRLKKIEAGKIKARF